MTRTLVAATVVQMILLNAVSYSSAAEHSSDRQNRPDQGYSSTMLEDREYALAALMDVKNELSNYGQNRPSTGSAQFEEESLSIERSPR